MGIFYSTYDKQQLFNWYCKVGEIVEAQKIYKSYQINIHDLYDVAFVDACEYGHLDIAKWLYSLGGVDLHAHNDEAFAASYRRGFTQVTKWLYSLDRYHYNNCQWSPIVKHLFN